MFTKKQFIVVQYISKTNGKSDKLPVDYQSKRVINPLDPQYWTTREVAEVTARALGEGYGIGFVFTESDGYFFYDIDDCVMDSQWSPVALDAMRLFPEAYLEVSHSGRGLHIIGHYETIGKHKCRSVGGELYHSHRFVALTGTQARGNPDVDCTGALAALIEQYFKPDITTPAPAGLSSTELPDDEIISRMLASKPSAAAAFGSKATLQQLWSHDLDALSIAFPASGRPDGWTYDRSAADASLAQHLAFWTNNNQSQMQRLMQRSGLARDKYDRGDYLPRTIAGACAKQLKGYSPSGVHSGVRPLNISTEPVDKTQENVHVPPAQVKRNTPPFSDAAHQQEYFSGCVYIRDENKILIPGGEMLNESRFNNDFGGASFVLSPDNSKITRKAWEAFTQSQVLKPPKVSSPAFRPDLAPGCIFEEQKTKYVNTYFPIAVERKVGDPSPFLDLIQKILPDPTDQKYLLGYFAAVVQFPGVKFMWAPMIQGDEGIGKSLLVKCLENAVGERYCHSATASELAGRFNGWRYGKILIHIEEFKIQHATPETADILKKMITQDRPDLESKGVDRVKRQVCDNYIFTTNYKNSLPITKNSRRYAVFITAQQSKEDRIRDGLTDDYFNRLIDWLKPDGFAIVAEFLHTYHIEDEFNPKLVSTAPITSTTHIAIAESASSIDVQIQEAIESGEQGFRGGWISSTMLNRYIKTIGYKFPMNQYGALVERLGYTVHPNLIGGRTGRVVMPDGNQTKLYIRKAHPLMSLLDSGAIATAYEDAQKHTPPPV